MSVKLIAIDLDDTLLDSGLRISDECAKAITAAREKGVMVTIATGRMYSSALPYARQLNIDVPLITYQGAWVKNSLSEEVLYYEPVPKKESIEIMEYFKKCGVHYHTYYDDRLCLENLTEEGKFYVKLAGVEPVIMDSLIDALDTYDPFKIMAVTDNERMLLDMELELKNNYGDNLHITRSKPFFLEVMNKKANKADALKVITDHYNIDRKEVMAVGDSYNDLAMIEWAGLGVAMWNARTSVKEVADFITTSNDEKGVAEAIHRFVLA
ncbi:Cof-like hydrolase [Candidatus Syntrophocurvum alkaliphilum]|uniref:Cof-like hydrolase n=1 Tax=Candidatus Syntrophocurvum alkaliphilum TaxID=2293317 RepID=A0A6I6DH07_9FIRM|nr:Cof-type HAD-IIB family hydrolase [Candidatus Syntrophocurvum alkaliphilum]QGU00373.1 Cof-like hydrolase [Candidatus Syntrophocurvum alkaliphilum]